MSERFCAAIEEGEEVLLYARKLGLKTYGISFYVGSQATEVKRWAIGIDTIRPTIESLYKQGVELEMINIGGGFPVIYGNHKEVPELRKIVAEINRALHKLPYIPK